MAKEHLRSSLCALDRMVKMMLRGWRITRMRDAARFICAGFVVAVTLPHLAAKAEAVEIPSWLRVQPGPVVYFIWSSPVDLDDPPASGNPPQELLAARAETANINSHWLGS